MKLASYQDGSRDGQLLVVSRDLVTAHYAGGIATRLRQVLDDWNFLSPQLEDLYTTLNQGKARHAFGFDAARCLAPLPRAYQWVVSVDHGAAPGGSEPVLQRRASDFLAGPHDAIAPDAPDADPACRARLAAVTGDVARGVSAAQALEGIRLLMLAHDSDCATAFGPVAVTPDELGPAWRGGRVHLKLQLARPGQRAEWRDAAAAMQFHFGQLIARLAQARPVCAGSIVGSEALGDGCGQTRLDMLGADGQSVFGSIAARGVA